MSILSPVTGFLRDLLTQRKSTNRRIKSFEDNVEKEISSLEEIIVLDNEKLEILRGISDLWNNDWKKAENFVKKTMPSLIRKQIGLIDVEIKAFKQIGSIINLLLKGVEEEKQSLIQSHLHKQWTNQEREILKLNLKEEGEIRGLLHNCNKNIVIYLTKLKERFEKQLELFEQDNSWHLIRESALLINRIKDDNQSIQNLVNLLNEELRKIKLLMAERNLEYSSIYFKQGLSYKATPKEWREMQYGGDSERALEHKLVKGGLIMVHMTNFFPWNGVIKTPNTVGLARGTLHFTINGPVTQVLGMFNISAWY